MFKPPSPNRLHFHFLRPHLPDRAVGRSFTLIPQLVFVSLPHPPRASGRHEVSCCVLKNCNMHLRWRFHRNAGTHHERTWIMHDASEPTHPVYHDCWTHISLIPVATIAPACCSILLWIVGLGRGGVACSSTVLFLTFRMSPSAREACW